MFWGIIKVATLSFVGIALLHSLYLYFIGLLTVPKVKDHVYLPANQYQELYQAMNTDTMSAMPNLSNTSNTNTPPSHGGMPDSMNAPNTPNTMKADLKEYLQNLGSQSGMSSRATSPVSAVTLRSTNNTPWYANQVDTTNIPTMGLDGGHPQEDGPLPTFMDL